jgi:SAM-dependent methyltransferase
LSFYNAYEDSKRAEAYSALEFPDTYYLAFRDLPDVFRKYARGLKALDFGCGAGRSTRFLVELGFEAIGIDISKEMIRRAKEIDPAGDYRLIGEDGQLGGLEPASFDLVFSAFTFDNIPTEEKKVALFSSFEQLLGDNGIVVNLVSSPEIYFHEWASFSTRNFPENKSARPGDIVKIITTAIKEPRPVEDIIWPDESYREVYRQAGLHVLKMLKPLARDSEPYEWVNETRIAPWAIYVLNKTGDAGK